MQKLLVLLLIWGGSGIVVSGCRHCDDTHREANAFLSDPSNQECTVDDDCVIETHNCSDLDDAYCGQITLSRTAAASAEWQDIRTDLRSCAKDPCDVCLARRIPNCSNGHCL